MKRKWLVVLVGLGVAWVALSVFLLARVLRPRAGPIASWTRPAPAPPPIRLAAQVPSGELTEAFHVQGMFFGVACGDVRGDGTQLILATGMESWLFDAEALHTIESSAQAEKLRKGIGSSMFGAHVHDLKGDLLTSFPFATDDPTSLFGGVVLAQLDDDPERELLLFGLAREEVSAHDTDGSPLWSHEAGFMPSVAAADVDGDGLDEVVVGRPTKGVRLLDSDGTVLWEKPDVFGGFASVGVGELTADGQVRIIVEGRPDLTRRDLRAILSRPSALINCLTVLDARGERVTFYEAPVAMTHLLVAELVEMEPGPELVVWGITIPGDDARLAALSGGGDVLWQVSLGTGLDAVPDSVSVGAGHVAAVTGEEALLVFDDQGSLVARKAGFRRRPGLALTADASGRPLIVVASSDGLFGYTIADDGTPSGSPSND